MHFFHKLKAQCCLKTQSFANVLYLSICMLGNCSCFYFRLLTFFKNILLQIKHLVSSSECQKFVSRSRPTFCWSSSGFKLFAKGYWQTTTFSTSMQRVITGKYFSVQYIIQYRIYMYMYTIKIRTPNTFRHAMPFKQNKRNIQRI